MKRHRGLLLTLIQIPLICALPHTPRKHGILRYHGSNAVVIDNIVVFNDSGFESSISAPLVESSTALESDILTQTSEPSLSPVSSAPAFSTSNALSDPVLQTEGSFTNGVKDTTTYSTVTSSTTMPSSYTLPPTYSYSSSSKVSTTMSSSTVSISSSSVVSPPSDSTTTAKSVKSSDTSLFTSYTTPMQSSSTPGSTDTTSATGTKSTTGTISSTGTMSSTGTESSMKTKSLTSTTSSSTGTISSSTGTMSSATGTTSSSTGSTSSSTGSASSSTGTKSSSTSTLSSSTGTKGTTRSETSTGTSSSTGTKISTRTKSSSSMSSTTSGLSSTNTKSPTGTKNSSSSSCSSDISTGTQTSSGTESSSSTANSSRTKSSPTTSSTISGQSSGRTKTSTSTTNSSTRTKDFSSSTTSTGTKSSSSSETSKGTKTSSSSTSSKGTKTSSSLTSSKGTKTSSSSISSKGTKTSSSSTSSKETKTSSSLTSSKGTKTSSSSTSSKGTKTSSSLTSSKGTKASSSSTSSKGTKTSSSTKSSSNTSISTKTKSPTSSTSSTGTRSVTKSKSSGTNSTKTSSPTSTSTTTKSSSRKSWETTTSTTKTIVTRTSVDTTTTESKFPTPYSTLTSSQKTRKPKPSKKHTSWTSATSATSRATHSLVPSYTISLTLATTLTISEVQTLTTTTTVPPETTGIIRTTLNTKGQNTLEPFKTTVIPTSGKSVTPITTGSNKISHPHTMAPTGTLSNNIFVPIASGAPVAQVQPRGGHPVPPLGIEQGIPIETNKFYANFFLGNRDAPTWTHPYSVAWVQGQGTSGSWGLSITQVPRTSTSFGPGAPPSYYTNPIGIQAIILSARELGASTALSVDQLKGFSCNVNLSPTTGSTPVITFPLVQGMAFVTGVYSGGTPFIQSAVFFQDLTYKGLVHGNTARYSVTLVDGTTWLIYLTAASGSSVPTLTLVDSGEIVGSQPFSGSVQVAKIPGVTAIDIVQPIYDASAGVYPLRGSVQASVQGSEGTYQLSWTKGGAISRNLLMFALPHHVQSFSSAFKHAAMKSALKLDTTTKGTATAIYGDSWELYHDDIPNDMGFAPWNPTLKSVKDISKSAMDLISSVAAAELAEDFTAQTDLDSMYFSGKGLAKFAFTVFAAHDMARDTGTASAGLVKLKDSFARFVNNQQINPLVYDTVWGGMVSSCTYTTGNTGCDFGNTFYNDHHFHYGYFVYAAAVIGYLDHAWLKEGSNKDWVNDLVRDYANPVSDGYFPFQRMFDWYHGHSWAHGLYESADGKDQESSSEDAFASYAIKMWGRTIGDLNMEARGNLMVAVQARSLSNYYLMQADNIAEPSVYLPNKASGIVFENKIDHTTYFGTNIEYIEGIHMIPLNPSSALTRSATFVQQEWETYFANGYVDTIDSGWRGILMANLAIYDPVTAYNFFAQPGFDNAWLDGGASRTWYLAYSAGLGGSLA